MRSSAPFRAADLASLDGLLSKATGVVAMRDVLDYAVDHRIIGMRHDVDNVIEPAVEFAIWEAERGYTSTYYILHTAPYWEDKHLLRESLYQIAGLGHEIGIHNNALAENSRTGRDPALILSDAIEELRSYGLTIRGTVAHGDHDCYGPDGKVRFVNDQIFSECVRPDYGLYGDAISLRSFRLDYDANWLNRGAYLSDSGGKWSHPFQETYAKFPFPGQLHMLVHPDWWAEAFPKVTV